MACNISDLDCELQGSLREAWYPFVLLNEGLLHIILLLAGSGYAMSHDMHPDQRERVGSCLADLRSQSLWHIRRMFSDPAYGCGDEIIGAVLKMASYESVYGSLDDYHMHMGALKRLITLRGGIEELGLDGLLGRMVLWVDYQAAISRNAAMYFVEDSNGLPKPLSYRTH